MCRQGQVFGMYPCAIKHECVCVCVCLSVGVCNNMCLCMHLRVCARVCVSILLCVCLLLNLSVCVLLCIYVCLHVLDLVCVYMWASPPVRVSMHVQTSPRTPHLRVGLLRCAFDLQYSRVDWTGSGGGDWWIDALIYGVGYETWLRLSGGVCHCFMDCIYCIFQVSPSSTLPPTGCN